MSEGQIITGIVILIVWFVSMYHLWTVGLRAGLNEGNHIGVTTTLELLEDHGVLDIEQYDKLLEKLKRER